MQAKSGSVNALSQFFKLFIHIGLLDDWEAIKAQGVMRENFD